MLSPAAKTPAVSLLPTLSDALRPSDKKAQYLITDLRAGDHLHTTEDVLGFPKGSALLIYGSCIFYDENGNPFSVLAYVRGGDAQHRICYSQREAKRYEEEQYDETWFASVLMYLTEIDLIDYANCLCLERQPEAGRLLIPVSTRKAA